MVRIAHVKCVLYSFMRSLDGLPQTRRGALQSQPKIAFASSKSLRGTLYASLTRAICLGWKIGRAHV